MELCNSSRECNTRLDRHSGLCTHCRVVLEATRNGGNPCWCATELRPNLMFGILHTDGSGEDNPPVERLSDLYDELLSADREHGDVSVIHDDSGWCMSAHR